MKILKNAIEAIQIGLEDFKNEDPRRAQSAIRNIFAGMLLLFKEQLRRMSPENSDEVLIKQIIIPILDANGELSFQGKGKKTVDVQQIRERFKGFGIIVDWKVIDEINNLRNNIEHYYTEESSSVINEVVSKSFGIIRDFCINYLEEEPSILLGPVSWDIFLETEEIYEKEKEESEQSLSKVDWTYSILFESINNMRCPSCKSDLIHAQDVHKYTPSETLPLRCKKCNEEFDFVDVIEECIIEDLASEAYLAIVDGGNDPYTECPECGQSTYVFSEKCCLTCGYQQENKTCLVCGTYLDIEEGYNGNICSYHKWAWEKAERD
ncbi:hypothetical protein SAMN02927916_3240 [Flavobacterium anhuiense]|uniref:Uncharacterized protein n=1 Tax=Flavobacterium anhuiense TaxID=459526 RepID=A0ABY0LXG4_9FLAO|nr:hypothetical protein [Flavobacterium anhuiense]SCY76075.1 hypothetical protein SAMN02927916_3240 [Flavobacterium anhuiense]